MRRRIKRSRLDRWLERQQRFQASVTPTDRKIAMRAGSIGWAMWLLGTVSYIGLDLLVSATQPNWWQRLLLILASFLLAWIVLAVKIQSFLRANVARRQLGTLALLMEAMQRAAKRSPRIAPEDRLPPVAETRCSSCGAAPGIRHDRKCPAIPATWFNAA